MIYVVTNPENGWDCVSDVFEADSEEQVRNYLLDESGYTTETVPPNWDNNHVIHSQTLTKLN